MRIKLRGKWILFAGTIVVGGALVVLLLLVRSTPTIRVAQENRRSATHADDGRFWRSALRLPAFAALEPVERPQEEPRDISDHPKPPGGLRAWSAEPVELAASAPGQEAPVRAHRLDTYDPAKPGPAPSPFIPPKKHLSLADTRAGLDATEVTQ